jgi:hypothetical protein
MKKATAVQVYFSDFFNVDPNLLEKYGAFNISLINDLPLFIDPFLLFNSRKPVYKKLHAEILRYVAFLRDRSKAGGVNAGLLKSWYCFPEVKQTWLGYSLVGNGGRGLSLDFARSLNENLGGIFADFDTKKISRSPHLEKLCLIKDGVGRDSISDFVTNLIKAHLLAYTEAFATKHIDGKLLRRIPIGHVEFNYETSSWATREFTLPFANGDYVLLTPKDLLTKDDTWICKPDLVNQFDEIVASVANDQLRSQLDFYFKANLPKPEKNKDGSDKPLAQAAITGAVGAVIRKYPELLDYYIRFKEDDGEHATSLSQQRVKEVQTVFVDELSGFIAFLAKDTKFYAEKGDTLKSAFDRVMFLKNVIENKDGYRAFYYKGEPVRREAVLQLMFRLTWFASPEDVTREANEGRGPVDFKISMGSADKTLVEFKLASNSKLAQNLQNQVEVYKKAHDTDKAIKVILYFTLDEKQKVEKILKDLGLEKERYVVLIDARNDNKESASKVRSAAVVESSAH